MGAEILSFEAGVWSRVIHPERDGMPVEAARYFANLGFEAADLERMHELTVRQQEQILTLQEQEALLSYRRVVVQMDLLRSKARLALRNADT